MGVLGLGAETGSLTLVDSLWGWNYGEAQKFLTVHSWHSRERKELKGGLVAVNAGKLADER